MKKLSVEITVPVYNEEKELEENIVTLYKFCEKNLKKYDFHITIADNASSDNTSIIAQSLHKKYPKIEYLRLEQKGRGRAVKNAWVRSNVDFYAYMDLDLSTDLIHLPKILQVLEEGFDVAIGSRLIKGARVEGRTMLREIISRTLNIFFIKLPFNTHFTDAQCGFKAVTKKIVNQLIPKVMDNDWFFDGELLIIAEKSGYRIYEEPIHWVDNPGSTVRLYSTIIGDIKVIWRLLRTHPWKSVMKN